MRELKYSELVLLTGAGASKACGLPDMREFAQLFNEQIGSVYDADSPALNLLDEILTPGDGPTTDLEGLMTALACLSGEIRDPAGELLMQSGRLSERDLARAVDRLSDHLAEWTTMAPLSAGPYQVVTRGAVYPINPTHFPSTAAINIVPSSGVPGPLTASGISGPLTASGLLASGPSEPPGITRDRVEKHRTSLSEARKVLDDWKGFFASLRPAAAELLKRLKGDIQKTYSAYKARPATRSYRPLVNELLRRFTYLDVFTLNYDMVLEGVLSSGRRFCFTGFKTSGNREWGNAFPAPAAPQDSVRLYKLHGSVNWYQTGRRVIELPAEITGVTTRMGPAETMMVYPMTQKLVYSEPHLTLFHHLARALRGAKRCLIIGCSLRDDLVCSTLAFAARDRPNLRFIFCGSGESIAANSWLKLLHKRFTVMDKRFGDDAFLTELKGILDGTT